MEHFYTLQGEGYYAGRAAYFIRLAGCDVGCTWCDVKESWPVETKQLMKIDELTALVKNSGGGFVVITGGEPTLYNLVALTSSLKKKGIEIAMETSGTNPLTGHIDWICFSPKKFKAPLVEYFHRANELKVIAYNKHDLIWAKELADKINPDCLLYIQPEWEKSAELNPLIIEFIKENPRWRISVQTHKYLNIP